MGQILTVITGGDPFEDDRRSQYEAERANQARRCAQNFKKDVWQGTSGTGDNQPAPRGAAPTRMVETYQSDDCQPGPWLPPSQRVPSAPMPRMELTPPGDLQWGNR